MTRRQLQRGDKLVVASHNPGKVWEIKQLIAPYGLDAISASDLNLPEPDETEKTFSGNARLKALAAATAANLPALADDSGLEVDALDGAPGIYSARWAGKSKDFTTAMAKVRDEVKKISGGWPKDAAKANFICVLCLAWPDGQSEFFEGKVFGHLVQDPRGGNGFGYDPMFVPQDETMTFGEMDPKDKHAMSHRAAAFAAFEDTCLDHIEYIEPCDDVENDDDQTDLTNNDAFEALFAAAANLSSEDELVAFIKNLRADFTTNNHDWENVTVPEYLEAMESWIDDTKFDDDPPWRNFAKILLAARTYE